MKKLTQLLKNNLAWSEKITKEDPAFFKKLSEQQFPEYLWIGCSDSRVPANQITGLLPGEIFVHRNVANLVIHTDLNCLSVIQYAVDVLRVEHIIVCGHYGCAGVQAVIQKLKLGLVDNWLGHLTDVYRTHLPALEKIREPQRLSDRLCELNVIEQVYHVSQTNIVQNAWKNNQPLFVHGWIYRLTNGVLKDLDVTMDQIDSAESTYLSALSALQ